MMYNLISEVPASISEFYVEVIKNEPTGEMVEEAFTYLDEEGVEQTGTRQVKAYADVAYVEQVRRPESKTESQLDQVISLSKPQRVLDLFAEMVSVGEAWSYFDEYKLYEEELSTILAFNEELPVVSVDEEGNDVLAELKELPTEPVKVVVRTGAEVLAPHVRPIFQQSRTRLVEEIVVTVDGHELDGDETSQTRMSRAISVMLDADVTPWVLTNNTVVELTKSQLVAALKLAGQAQTELWVM
jgi:hypothetical protein